jgi:hypothetical protein
MPGRKLFVLAAVSAALAVAPAGAAVAAPVTGLTPLDGDELSEEGLVGNPGKKAANCIACDGIGAVVGAHP